MNVDDVEKSIRTALQDNVRGINAATLSRPALPEPHRRPVVRSWALAAAAAVAVTAVAILTQFHARDSQPPVAAAARPAVGTWRLVSASIGAAALELPAAPTVTISFTGDGKMLVHDGVNTTTVTVQWHSGAFEASFDSTTYALDGDSSPARRQLLTLLNSMAPGSYPGHRTRNADILDGDRFTATTSVGVLIFERAEGPVTTAQLGPSRTPPADVPRGTSSTGASTSLSPS